MDTVVEILIDYSISMGDYKDNAGNSCLLPDGSTRLSLAKSCLVDIIIPTLSFADEINIRKFYGTVNPEKLILNDVYKGAFSPELGEIINQLKDPVSTGSTPISSAISKVFEYLKDNEKIDKKLILITDGENTDKVDFYLTARNAFQELEIPYKFYIVGIGLSVISQEKCQKAVNEAGGFYVNLEAHNYDKSQLITKFGSMVRDTVEYSRKVYASKNKETLNTLSQEIQTSQINGTQTILQEEFLRKMNDVFSSFTKQFDLVNKNLDILNSEFKNKKQPITQSDFEKIEASIEIYNSKIMEMKSEINERYASLEKLFSQREVDFNNFTDRFTENFSKLYSAKFEVLKIESTLQKNKIISEQVASEERVLNEIKKLENPRNYDGIILFLLFVMICMLGLLLYRSFT